MWVGSYKQLNNPILGRKVISMLGGIFIKSHATVCAREIAAAAAVADIFATCDPYWANADVHRTSYPPLSFE